MFFLRANLPQNLPQNPEPNFHVALGKRKPSYQAANSRIRVGDAPPVEETAGVQSFQQRFREALDLGGRRELQFVPLAFRFGVANEFIQADGHRLSQVHGNIFFARGDAHQPVAMAEIFVRQAEFLGAEKQRDVARAEALANQPRAVFKTPKRMLQFTVPHRRGSHHQRAIRHRFGHRLELFRLREQFRSADGGARLAEARVVRIHDAQAAKTEVAHGARRSAHVERVARSDQHHAQAIEIGGSRQESLFYVTLAFHGDRLHVRFQPYRRARALSILDLSVLGLSMRMLGGSNRMRNALLIADVFLAAIFFAPNVETQTAAEPTYKIAATTIPAPEELPAPVRDAISPNALAVGDAKGAYCEIWLRNSIPTLETPDKSIGVIFGQMKPGTLVGAIKLELRVDDYRRQPIQPGVYTLRYMLEPVDGNHQGVSPDRDFLLLVPASLDLTPADLPADTLLELSRKSSGTLHPSVWSLVLPPADPPPANLPAIVHQSKSDLWILCFNAPLETPAVMGLVLVGHAPTT